MDIHSSREVKKQTSLWKKEMVYHQKLQQLQRKVVDEEQLLLCQHNHNNHHHHPKFYFFLFSFVSVAFLFGILLSLLVFPSCFSISNLSFQEREETGGGYHVSAAAPFCSSASENTICCDRTTSTRTDVCVMRGDVRTRSISSSIHLYSSAGSNVTEKIRPYTRKWEKSVMDTVDELKLVADNKDDEATVNHKCDVRHDVPAVVFSTGGYTGNVYHEFNDGIIPLYITSQHFNKKVVFVIVEYHDWWMTKYGNILSQLSDYDPIDFSGDNRTHCFPEATVGLKIHDELAVDASRMVDSMSILNFRQMLDRSYRSRIEHIEKEEEQKSNATAASDEPSVMVKPRLVILSRNGSRGLDNEADLVNLCEEIGFDVRVIRPDKTTELARIYRELNQSDAMIGVHGAAMTHLLFMRPKTAFIQIVPLGTDWAAEAYYGEPAKKMGLKYVEYKIRPKESSLYSLYDRDDPVLQDPSKVAAKGWQVTKEVYLDRQSVKLDLNRFLKRITRVYQYAVRRKNKLELDYDWSWQQPSQGTWQMRRR